MSTTLKPPFQFTIRGLMLMTAVIAVGMSIGCLKTAKAEDGLFAFAATWIVIGLVAQIVDLCIAFRRATGLSPDQRFGWWFAIFWRGALAVLLLGHFLIIALLATGRLTLAGGDEPASFYMGPMGHHTLRSAILAMALLLVLAGPTDRTTPTSSRLWTAAINLATIVGVVVVVYYFLLDRFLVYDLVHIACEGIALGLQHGPAEYSRIYADARTLSFFSRAILASGLIFVDLLGLRLVIARWKQGAWQRAVLMIALGLSLALTAIHPLWLATRGLKEVSPFYAEVFAISPINRWIFAVVLTIMFVTAAARCMIRATWNAADKRQGDWRRHSGAYYQEYRLLALFVAASTVWLAYRTMLDMRYYSVTDSLCLLWLLVFGLAVYRAIFGVGKRSESLGAAPPEMPLSLFAVVWTALLAIVVMAVPIIAAFGFGLSLIWWRLPF